jgi:hypothetical protein
MKKFSAARSALGLALLLAVVIAPAAGAAAKVPVTVRAVTWKGEILFDREVRTGTTSVPTSSKATCFGGSPSNSSATIPGATALGALQDAAMLRKPRRPLLLTNAFDFGLGVCGVGDDVATGEQWWELSVNHKPSSLGGEGTKLKAGDTVLWYLSETFNRPSPDELRLSAPDNATAGKPITVRVVALNDQGRARPVKGAKLSVPGAAPTDARGVTRVTLGSNARLVARAGDLIPSNRELVKVAR